MPKTGKGVRAGYDPKAVDNAVAEVNACKMSIRQASIHFGILKSTIGDRISGRVHEGTTPVFPAEVERKFADKLKDAAKMGFGLTRPQIRLRASRLAMSMKLKTPFRKGISGNYWLKGFMNRHPDILLRSPTPLTSVRARMLNIEVTNRYFDGLTAVIQSLNLQNAPKRIWNIDETNVSLTHKPSKVLAEMGQRNVPGRVGNCRDGVRVLAYVNAAGEGYSPFGHHKRSNRKSSARI